MHTARFTLELLLLSPCSCSVLRLHLCSTHPGSLSLVYSLLAVCVSVCVSILPQAPCLVCDLV